MFENVNDPECWNCFGAGCEICHGSGSLPDADDFGDRADYEYDKRRDEEMEKDL